MSLLFGKKLLPIERVNIRLIFLMMLLLLLLYYSHTIVSKKSLLLQALEYIFI